MAYSNFTTFEQVRAFGIRPLIKILFHETKLIKPSDWLKMTLSYSSLLRSRNEKTKSESIVYPILSELVKSNQDIITFYSGSSLNVNKEKGLNGECDFIIAKDIYSFDIQNPILQIVEAKNHDINIGIPQCAVQMYAADIFNKKNDSNINCIYGCVTTGNEWQFMKLCEEELFVDKRKYFLIEIDKILGIFQTIIDTYKE